MNWIESAVSMMAIILEKTSNIFFEINFSDFMIIKNNTQVISSTKNNEVI